VPVPASAPGSEIQIQRPAMHLKGFAYSLGARPTPTSRKLMHTSIERGHLKDARPRVGGAADENRNHRWQFLRSGQSGHAAAPPSRAATSRRA
jgi:hypothetical protein